MIEYCINKTECIPFMSHSSHDHRHEDHKEEHEEKELRLEIRHLKEAIRDLIGLIKNVSNRATEPVSSSLILKRGELKVPLTVKKSDPPGSAKYQEFNKDGAPVGPKGSVMYASDNEGVATVDVNGQLAYIGGGSCNIGGTDTGKEGLESSDSLTVIDDTVDNEPVSSTLTLNPGVAPAPAGLRAGVAPRKI